MNIFVLGFWDDAKRTSDAGMSGGWLFRFPKNKKY